MRQPNKLHIEVLLHSRALKTLRLREALPDAEHIGSEGCLEVSERSGANVVTYHEKEERALCGAVEKRSVHGSSRDYPCCSSRF